jgi:hypothetical protein
MQKPVTAKVGISFAEGGSRSGGLVRLLTDSHGVLFTPSTKLQRNQWANLGNKTTIEVLPAVTMKNIVFWDTKTQFAPHRKQITSPLKGPAG